MELKKHFITTERPYREGAVEVFEQNIPHVSARKAVLTITALGVYEGADQWGKDRGSDVCPGLYLLLS